MKDDAVEQDEKLNLKTKLAYGVGDLAASITGSVVTFFLLIFLTNVAGIPIRLAGSILMISKIWDAVNDPTIGWLTDKTKSRLWGRRLPWLVYGAFPFGGAFFLEWLVPQFSPNHSHNIWTLFCYYAVVGAIFYTLFTVVNLPYIAMTPELTQDYDERTELNSFRFTFSIGGSIVSLLLAQIIFSQVHDPQQQYLILAGICSVIAILSLYACVWGTRDRALAFEARRFQMEETPIIPFWEQLKIVFSNRPFVFVVAIYLFSWLAVQVTAPTIPYFVIYCMKLENSDFPKVMLAVQGTALTMLFVWSAVSKRFGKKLVYILGVIPWIIAACLLCVLPSNQVGLLYILAITAGFGVSVAYLIPWSMIPDVIELDELQTGQRREGIFYGFMILVQKFGAALGLFLVGNYLQSAGFKENVAGQSTLPIQPESALLAIRICLGIIPVVCLIIGLILTIFYPITREVHAEVMLKLQQRRERN